MQQLALILTGAGLVPIKATGAPPLAPAAPGQAQVVRKGLFEFNPARHQPGDKMLLGQRIVGGGLDEIERAVQLLVRQPACAHFISQRLAEYFVSDTPPTALVTRMANTFQHSDGDIAKVMQTMLASPEFAQAQPRKFKDPNRFVVSAMRVAYEEQPVINAAPMASWVQQLGEPLFGRITPDGWSLQSQAWTSSGQLARRFEVARSIGGGPKQLFRLEGDNQTPIPALVQIETRPSYRWLAPSLSAATRQALDQARSPAEWNGFCCRRQTSTIAEGMAPIRIRRFKAHDSRSQNKNNRSSDLINARRSMPREYTMQRRQFLLASAAAASMPWAGRLFAAPRDSARMLVVFLRGGYDSNNLLVPHGSDFIISRGRAWPLRGRIRPIQTVL